MKAIIISTRLQWVELILNGIKKDEIRKGTAIGKAINRLIEEQGVAPMLLYCTKNKKAYLNSLNNEYFWLEQKDILGTTPNLRKITNATNGIYRRLNGKVVARFNATVDFLELKMIEGGLFFAKQDKDVIEPDLNENARIDNFELLRYTGYKLGTRITDIHINDLEIFDKPKEISEFYKVGYENSVIATKKYILCSLNREERRKYKTELDLKINNEIAVIKDNYKLTRAPQSYCFIEID